MVPVLCVCFRELAYSNITAALGDLLAKDRDPTITYHLPSRPGPPAPQEDEGVEEDSPRKRVSKNNNGRWERVYRHVTAWLSCECSVAVFIL